eukprot:gene3791-4314_t
MKHRQLRTPINYLLLNLSISDILAGISIYPHVFLKNIRQISTSPKDLRILCSFTEGLSVYFIAVGVSLSTLSVVSLYRYVLVRFPLRALWTHSKRTVKVIITSVWMTSIVVISPSAATYKYSSKLDACIRDWHGMNADIYRILTWLLTIVLPLIFLIHCYLALRFARRAISRNKQGCSYNRLRMMKRSEQLVAMLIINFVICWTPFFLYWGIATFSLSFPQTYDGQTEMLKWVHVTILFSAVHSSVDPFLFAASNKEIREKAKKLLCKPFLDGYANTASVVRLRVKRHRNNFTI